MLDDIAYFTLIICSVFLSYVMCRIVQKLFESGVTMEKSPTSNGKYITVKEMICNLND